MADDDRTEQILSAVRAIPVGFVRTYGDIDPGAPRLVGRVLRERGAEVPWHRVVRADGTFHGSERQAALLTAEGVALRGARVDLRDARLPMEPGRHAG